MTIDNAISALETAKELHGGYTIVEGLYAHSEVGKKVQWLSFSIITENTLSDDRASNCTYDFGNIIKSGGVKTIYFRLTKPRVSKSIAVGLWARTYINVRTQLHKKLMRGLRKKCTAHNVKIG